MQFTDNIFDKAIVQELRTLKGQQRLDLIDKFWPEAHTTRKIFDEFACGAIVEYLANELDQVRHHGRLFAAQDFESTFAIIQTLKENQSELYERITRNLLGRFPTATSEAVRRSVELSIRLWLTLNIHTSDIFIGPISAGDTPIDWAEDASLEQLLRRQFGQRIQSHRQPERARFEPFFTVAYLVTTCGLRLRWTDDIAAHLSFDPKRIVLTVYRHKACLVSHINNRHGCPIPLDVLEETLDTMNLLFPFGDGPTKRLLLKEGQMSIYTLGSCNRSRNFDLGHYQFFGEVLEHIIDSFDKSPKTWKQLAFDRRNKLEWSAFWVTVMVGILTIVSIPCNIIQATYSVKAYQATIAQANAAQQREL